MQQKKEFNCIIQNHEENDWQNIFWTGNLIKNVIFVDILKWSGYKVEWIYLICFMLGKCLSCTQIKYFCAIDSINFMGARYTLRLCLELRLLTIKYIFILIRNVRFCSSKCEILFFKMINWLSDIREFSRGFFSRFLRDSRSLFHLRCLPLFDVPAF